MPPPINAKDLVAQVEKEILSAGSWRTPVLRAIRKSISRRIISLDRQLIIEAALALISRNKVHRFIPYELVQNHPAAMAGITWSEVEGLGKGMASWNEVDCFGCFISGPAWAAGRIGDVKIKAWATSADRWHRRATLANLFHVRGRPMTHVFKDTAKRLTKLGNFILHSWRYRRKNGPLNEAALL